MGRSLENIFALKTCSTIYLCCGSLICWSSTSIGKMTFSATISIDPTSFGMTISILIILHTTSYDSPRWGCYKHIFLNRFTSFSDGFLAMSLDSFPNFTFLLSAFSRSAFWTIMLRWISWFFRLKASLLALRYMVVFETVTKPLMGYGTPQMYLSTFLYSTVTILGHKVVRLLRQPM